MATDDKDKKISQFDLEATLDGNELVPIVKDGVNYKTTLADVRSGLVSEERVEAVEKAQAEDLRKITELAGKLNGVSNVQEELNKKQPTGDYATRNELDVVETLAESVNQGLGETIQRVETLEEGLQADKTNLANFKAHVEADFVKDTDYNNDKGTIMGEIMKKADKSYVQEVVDNELGAASGQLDVINQLKEALKDDDTATAVTKVMAENYDEKSWEQLKADADKAFKKQLKFSTVSASIAANKTLICHEDTRTWDFCPEYQGVTGITVEQMRELLRYYPKMEGRGSDYAFASAPIRFAIISGSSMCVTPTQPNYKDEHWCTRDDFSYMFVGSEVEYIFIGGTWGSCQINNMTAFKGASKLRAIYGGFQSNANWAANQTFDFSGCTSLEYIQLSSTATFAINFKDSAKILYSSLNHIVTTSRQNTITVHADVYKALSGEASEYPFNGGSREEWEALLELAGTKSVTFVSA